MISREWLMLKLTCDVPSHQSQSIAVKHLWYKENMCMGSSRLSMSLKPATKDPDCMTFDKAQCAMC